MAATGTSSLTSPIPIDKLEAWFSALTQQSALIEFLVLSACMGLAWLLTSLVRRSSVMPLS